MVRAVIDGGRESKIGSVLRPLGNRALSAEQADRAAQLLGVSRATVYRLRQRFLANPVASSLKRLASGPKAGNRRLSWRVEAVIDDVLSHWLPRQRHIAHPQLDITKEVRRRCVRAGLEPPSRNTVARRWRRHQEALAVAESNRLEATIPPGNFTVENTLDVVEIDHTQADVMVVDEWFRRPIGRPWLTLAIDVATRCIVGLYLSMDRPGAATVALVLTRIVLPKAAWLASLKVDGDWPMHGLPRVLHLDNAAEFKSKALRAGCSEYGIDLMYRPVGRPNFGGHIERLNRTLMERLRGLPGATGSSPKGRKARAPEKHAVLTVRELESWLALEVAHTYHHAEHRGLMGATPASTWQALTQSKPVRHLSGSSDSATRFLVQFLPLARRSIQADGLTLFYVRYWHPIFVAWRQTRRTVTVRYHPEDLSRIFVRADGKEFIEVRYADLRRAPISLWEQRAAVRFLRSQGHGEVSEMLLFKAIEEQRRLVARARTQTQRLRRKPQRTPPDDSVLRASVRPASPETEVDYSKPAPAYEVEQW